MTEYRRTWYKDDYLSLQDIADLAGTSLATVRLALLKYDVPIRPALSPPGRPRSRVTLPALHGLPRAP
ncbi:hypothetical protein [Streptomyces olivaceoviridis]|uniref:hypothetical protein n=1 Tax=Streptomyces olivaceoviridis TaxID=1921 RepID=UPI0036FBFFA9